MFKTKEIDGKFTVGYTVNEVWQVLYTCESQEDADLKAKELNKPVTRGEFEMLKKRFS